MTADNPNETVIAWIEQVEELGGLLEADPPEDGGSLEGWAELGRRVLDERHELERVIHDGTFELADETAARFMEADQELEAQLWRLTALNEHRQRRLAVIAPEGRAAAWWYSRGAQLEPDAVTHLGAVAAMTACFPEARRELVALRDAESLLQGQASVLSLGEASPLVRVAPPRKDVSLWGLGLSAAAALFAIFGVAAFLSVRNAGERAELEKAALQAQLLEAEASANQEVERLRAQAATTSTMSAAEKRALDAKLRLAERAAERAAKNAAAGSAASSQSGSSKALRSGPKCDPNDPMCGSP